MPTVKDKATGDVVSQQPYTSEGTQRAKQIAGTDPNWEISYAPNGKTDGAMRSQQMYAGGGEVGYNEIGMYKKGGKVKDKRVKDYEDRFKAKEKGPQATKGKFKKPRKKVASKPKKGSDALKEYQKAQDISILERE